MRKLLQNGKKQFTKGIALATAALLAVQTMFITMPEETVLADDVATAKSVKDIQDGVTLHCWNWSYSEIEKNMKLISDQGFTAIQTSPIQQVKEPTVNGSGYKWWVFYQPANFKIDDTGKSALGTKAEFKKMCETADKYGIKVIVDIVANHMGNNKGNDKADSIDATFKNDDSCWHDISKNTADYDDRIHVTQYCMSGLPDLNTANKKVQNAVLALLKECIDCGADGFRFDAVKHIETPDDDKAYASDFWPTVINGAKDYAKSKGVDLYCYGELLDTPGGKIQPSSYTKYMSITDNSWSNSLRGSISAGNVSGVSHNYHKAGTGASQLVLWAESHDTYANDNGESTNVSVENINKTWAFVAARKDAMGLYFARPIDKRTALGKADVTGWSYDAVQEANRFHTAFIGQEEYLANEDGILYCERGTSGVVLVNSKGTSKDVNVKANKIKAGTYIDQISGEKFTVSDGRIKGKIGSTGIAVVYGSSKIDNGPASGSTEGKTQSNDVETILGTGENIAYIELPADWGNKVYCYVYDKPTEKVNNGSWPGVEMTHVSDRIYSYKVPTNIDQPLVIFYSDDSHRYPADMEPGLQLVGGMIYKDDSWVAYNGSGDSGSQGGNDGSSNETTAPKDTTPAETTTETDTTVEETTSEESTTDKEVQSTSTDESTSEDVAVNATGNEDNDDGSSTWIIVVIVLVVLAAGGGIGFFIWKKSANPTMEDADIDTDAETVAENPEAAELTEGVTATAVEAEEVAEVSEVAETTVATEEAEEEAAVDLQE